MKDYAKRWGSSLTTPRVRAPEELYAHTPTPTVQPGAVMGPMFMSDDVQNRLNQQMTPLEAYQETSTSVALPGTSEHATGLAVDIISTSYGELDDRQGDTAEQKWLMEHCWEYGFILRYPPEKSDITGIIYEPWHYRYVGKDAAQEITEQGITLEEYLE